MNKSVLNIGAFAVLGLGQALAAGACGARSELRVPDPCAGEAALQADLAPLDIVIMMDNSGSMEFVTPTGQSRRSAVRNAFDAFFELPETVSTSVSFSYFPIIDNSVPSACVSDEECGWEGACQPYFVCLPSGGGTCRSNGDCHEAGFPGDACEQLGFCEDLETQCAIGPGGCGTGSCMNHNQCENQFTCDPIEYSTALVDMTALPEGGDRVLVEFGRLGPEGGTPILPALTGAIEQARARAAAFPGHTVIVLLATDGLPTACDPEIHGGDPAKAIDNIVAAADAGSVDGITTFVIGLATPRDGRARDDLDRVARAGGTGHAFVVDSEITQELAVTLAEVRLAAGACSFSVDFGDELIRGPQTRVRLELSDGRRPYVKWRPSEAACGDGGGFYFDPPVDPQRLVLCPSTCSQFGSSISRNIEVFTDCPL